MARNVFHLPARISTNMAALTLPTFVFWNFQVLVHLDPQIYCYYPVRNHRYLSEGLQKLSVLLAHRGAVCNCSNNRAPFEVHQFPKTQAPLQTKARTLRWGNEVFQFYSSSIYLQKHLGADQKNIRCFRDRIPPVSMHFPQSMRGGNRVQLLEYSNKFHGDIHQHLWSLYLSQHWDANLYQLCKSQICLLVAFLLLASCCAVVWSKERVGK